VVPPPITITDVLTQVTAFFNGLVAVILGLLVPATGTVLSPLQVVMWAGLIFGFIGLVLGLIKKMASSNGG
jgi:hypothetical protein